jgi:hypothetical protein
VLLDHGEEVAEERALLERQLAGDRIGLGGLGVPVDLPDAGMAAAVGGLG